MAVWLVRDCGLSTYQVTANFGAGYYAPKTTETLINYTACVCLAWQELKDTQIILRVQVPCMRAAKHTSKWQGWMK